jgi:hypothetical protein
VRNHTPILLGTSEGLTSMSEGPPILEGPSMRVPMCDEVEPVQEIRTREELESIPHLLYARVGEYSSAESTQALFIL